MHRAYDILPSVANLPGQIGRPSDHGAVLPSTSATAGSSRVNVPGFGAQWAAQYPDTQTQLLGSPQGMYGMPPGDPMHSQPAYRGLRWMSAHQGMMYLWLTGLHANGVLSMSTVNPMVMNVLAPAVNVAPTPAVSQAPVSGSGSAPPSTTSRLGVVSVNAEDDDDSEESYDDNTSGQDLR